MSREVCKHGVEIQQFDVRGQSYRGTICCECANDTERKERRAEWIRNNMVSASMYAAKLGYYGEDAGASQAEDMADELIRRGHL